MDQIGQLIVGVMGGGLIATVPVIMSAVSKHRKGQLEREDTAIKKWKEFATAKEKDAAQAWKIVGDFRKWYYRLWAQYVRITGDDETYPADPVQEESRNRKVNEDNAKRKLKSDEAE